VTGRTLVRLRRGVLVFLATLVVATGCGGSGSTPSALSSPTGETPPDLAKFLQLPVATPSACPSNVSGSTVGRASPWVGHVDLSVFISTSATKPEVAHLAATLNGAPLVHKVYFESQDEAYQEFQRLYTCWTSVSKSQTPASYRVVLVGTATLIERNDLVQRLVNIDGVDSVSCNPTVPCTTIHKTSS